MSSLQKKTSSLPANVLADRVVQRLIEAEKARAVGVGPGVYVFSYRDEVVYVGESRCIQARVLQHCCGDDVFGVPEVRIAWLETPDRKAVEKQLIAVLHPRLNGKNSSALYFWRRAALGIPDGQDDPVTAQLRLAVDALRVIAEGRDQL